MGVDCKSKLVVFCFTLGCEKDLKTPNQQSSGSEPRDEMIEIWSRDRMKIKVKSWTAVATWRWVANDDSCGICRMPFDGCCSDCKLPGRAHYWNLNWTLYNMPIFFDMGVSYTVGKLSIRVLGWNHQNSCPPDFGLAAPLNVRWFNVSSC